MNKPLQGVKVVDCTFYVAGPTAGRCLADWGAEVIKVEPPRGEPGRAIDPACTIPDANFNFWNCGKKGVVINSKDPEGAEILDKLIASADVFLTSYRTDALRRMGLSWETLHEKYPRLVWAQVNGFGDEGPDAAAPGFDTVAYWARSGAMSDFVPAGSPIIIPPVAFGDANTGAVLAGGIAAALFGRERTGVGEKVMISLYGNAIYNMSYLVYDTQLGHTYPRSHDGTPISLMNSFRCKDGKWIYMAILEHERFYNPLIRLIGREDLVDDPRYCTFVAAKAHQSELTAILDEGFLLHTRDEWDEILTKADIAHTSVRSSVELLDDPQALANNYLVERTFSTGEKMKITSTPIKFGNVEDDGFVQAPVVGGPDTVEVLHTLGYDDDAIRQLQAKGAVKAIWKE